MEGPIKCPAFDDTEIKSDQENAPAPQEPTNAESPEARPAPLKVPNGTETLSAEVAHYVDRYRGFARQTADGIIGLAMTLVEAEEKLSTAEFKIFCELVGIPKGGPVYKKFTKIGEAATRFEPYMEKLPSNWTTVYKLAALPPDKFDRVAQSLTPFITAREIDENIELNRGFGRVAEKREDAERVVGEYAAWLLDKAEDGELPRLITLIETANPKLVVAALRGNLKGH
jgi:hypothetical protein